MNQTEYNFLKLQIDILKKQNSVQWKTNLLNQKYALCTKKYPPEKNITKFIAKFISIAYVVYELDDLSSRNITDDTLDSFVSELTTSFPILKSVFQSPTELLNHLLENPFMHEIYNYDAHISGEHSFSTEGYSENPNISIA